MKNESQQEIPDFRNNHDKLSQCILKIHNKFMSKLR